ncbi:MAG: hypothetical protein MUC54_05775, partial [Chloroflexi bacterium]|nr:hypothetical protein [Chloroflexota bacterium]
MAARLQMKLGVIAETDRLEDSPDAVVVVEPTIGATLRSKGSLYLIVSADGTSRRLAEATRLVADTVEGEYYYDESAGVGVCLQKAVRTASRRLGAQRDRLGLGGDGSRPLGLVAAVVRGNELYVLATGPAEAYLVRQAHLLTLPEANRGPGLPDDEHVPQVWRGEISVGDSVVLVSANVTSRLGPDELKDAVVTLHPQAAMEDLHRRFLSAGGSGSDGALALEAAEVSATARGPKPVPARPPEPLAGQPDRSPIPLADSVGAAGAAVSGGASRARAAAGGAAGGLVRRLQDLLPRRGPQYRRVTPAASRRDTQRRAAIGALLFVGVLAALGLGVWWLAGRTAGPDLPEIGAGQRALEAAADDIRLVFDNGADLVVDDPRKAEELLLDAHDQLGQAAEKGILAVVTDPLRDRVVDGLDRLWGMVEITPKVEFSFVGQDTTFDLGGLVRGPDGAPYVLDRATKTVYRVDLRAKKASPVVRAGKEVAGATVGTPRHLAMGGQDVIVLDDKNVLWRWRPTDTKGKGTLSRVRVDEASTWGADVTGIGTYVRKIEDGLYNLYVIDPSEQQILRYSPAADGGGFPADATGYFTTPQDVSRITDLYIDGELYAADDGQLARYYNGQRQGWEADSPGDELLRPTRRQVLVDSPDAWGEGNVYAFETDFDRLLVVRKSDGAFVGQYRIAGDGDAWADVRDLYVVNRGQDQAPVIWWIDGEELLSAPLE